MPAMAEQNPVTDALRPASPNDLDAPQSQKIAGHAQPLCPDHSSSDDELPLTASKLRFRTPNRRLRKVVESDDETSDEYCGVEEPLTDMKSDGPQKHFIRKMSPHKPSPSVAQQIANPLPDEAMPLQPRTPQSPKRKYLKKMTSTPGGMGNLSARLKAIPDEQTHPKPRMRSASHLSPPKRSIEDSDLEQEEQEAKVRPRRTAGHVVPFRQKPAFRKGHQQTTHTASDSDGSSVPPVSLISRSEKLLVAHIRAFERDHESFTKICLSQARRSLDTESTDAKISSKRRCHPLKRSPFEQMQSLNSKFTDERKEEDLHQLLCLTSHDFPVSSSNTQKLVTVPVQRPDKPLNEPAIPRYRAFTRLNKNVLRQNDRKLLVWPHFEGDLEPEILEYRQEIYSRYTQENPPRRNDWLPKEEKARVWEPYISEFLAELPTNCSSVVVLQYLLGTCDLEDDKPSQVSPDVWKIFENFEYWGPRKDSFASNEEFNASIERWAHVIERVPAPTDEQLLVASLACAAFHRVCGFSLWHVAKICSATKTALEPLNERKCHSITFTKLACRICHIHDCPYHGQLEEYVPQDLTEADTVIDLSDPHKLDDQVRVNRKIRMGVQDTLSRAPKEPNIEWYYQRREPLDDPTLQSYLALSEGFDHPTGLYNKRIPESDSKGYFEDRNICSKDCFWYRTNRKASNYGDWSNSDKLLFDQLVHAYAGKKRGPCVLSRCLMKPCNEVFQRMLLAAPSIELPTAVVQEDVQAKKASKWWKQPRAYPIERGVTFYPCQHEGPCEEGSCSCARMGINCEKTCKCSTACSIRFPGCTCKRVGNICWGDEKCHCFKSKRECDEDLCGKCGASEVLSLRNRGEDSITQGRCGNVCMQRGKSIRTITGASTVSGTGLFVGEQDGVEQGQYIGEYKAEILSKGEADRLGSIYHYEPMNFLFGLNESQDLDATRAGNKMRFVNHSSDPANINCKADLLLCNGTLRISFRATRSISCGQELLFNYYWTEKALQGFVEKTADNATLGGLHPTVYPSDQANDKHSDLDIDELIREADRKYDLLADDDYVEGHRGFYPSESVRESPRNRLKKRPNMPQDESPSSRQRHVRQKIVLNL